MCRETQATIAARIIALLATESVPWTGNEILARILAGDAPCEAHFDETLRALVRERKLSSESDPLAPSLTLTLRGQLGYVLAADVKAASIRARSRASTPPHAERTPPPAAPRPAASPVPGAAPLLPSPAVRLELIGRLREEKSRVAALWSERFGPDCFHNGPAEFVKTVYRQARSRGIAWRWRDTLERDQDREIPDFDAQCEKLVMINDREGTIPAAIIDAEIKLDPLHYVSLDLDRSEREIREGKEGNPANAREILSFLETIYDDPVLLASTRKIAPVPTRPLPSAPPPTPAPSPVVPPALRAPAPVSPEPVPGSPAGSPAKSATRPLLAWTLVLLAGGGAGTYLWKNRGDLPFLTPPASGPASPAKQTPEPSSPPTPAPESASELEAARLYPDRGKPEALETLLVSHAATRAGRKAAEEILQSFDRSIPEGESSELVGPQEWAGWESDLSEAKGGSARLDPAGHAYLVQASSPLAQARLLRRMKGAERGVKIRWSFEPGISDEAAFMVAFSSSRWLDLAPNGMSLYRLDGSEAKLSRARRIALPGRTLAGVLTVFPHMSLELVYLDGRLVFALPQAEWGLRKGLQFGMSGGSLRLESVRILDRTED